LIQIKQPQPRGSKADMTANQRDLCFTPESGHVRRNSGCLLWAIRGSIEMPATVRDPLFARASWVDLWVPQSCLVDHGSDQ